MRTLLLLAFLITHSMMGQHILESHKLSLEQAKEDYDLYVRLLKETHPGLYRYTEKEKMDKSIDSLSGTLTDSISIIDLYKKIAWLSSSINCSHTYTIPSEDFDSYTLRGLKSIPFYVIPTKGKFYVLFNGSSDESIKPGFEIVSINNQSIEKIVNTIKAHFWTDGKIDLANNTALQGRLFRAFYYLFVDRSPYLDFRFKDDSGNLIEKQIQGVSTLTAMRNYKKNPVNKEVFQLYNKTQKGTWKVSFPKDMARTAVITIPGFGAKKVNSDEEALNKMKTFMDHAMKKIKSKGVQNLIIELRENRGGWDVMGTTLMSYLLQEQDSIAYYGPSFTITNDTEFLKYSDLSDVDLATVKKELEPMPDGTFKLKTEYNLSHGWVRKNPNAFKGKIYILMNEYTASAAAEFCAIAKSNKIGVLVGQETNGTYGGLNGTSFIKFPLPNSKVVVNTPMVRGNNMVQAIQPLDRGVLPDYAIDFSIGDILKRKDTQLEFVENLIHETTKD